MDRKVFHEELSAQIQRAQRQGRKHIEVNAGELHRNVGGFPPAEGKKHAMYVCCQVMRTELARGAAEVIHDGAKSEAHALTIRYDLPRPPAAAGELAGSDPRTGHNGRVLFGSGETA